MTAVSIAKAKDFTLACIDSHTKVQPALAEKKIVHLFSTDFEIKDIDIDRVLLELVQSNHIIKEYKGFIVYRLTDEGRLFMKTTSFQQELHKNSWESIKEYQEKRHQTRLQEESVSEAKRSNDIAEESLIQSRRANIISIVAIGISILAIIVSLIAIDLSN